MFCNRCALAHVLWCLAAFSVASAAHGLPFIDGTGVPWVLTWTHQRDAPPKQGGGDIREPTLCGWCCRGRQCRHNRACVTTRVRQFSFVGRHTSSAENTWRGVRTTHSVMATLTTQLSNPCDRHIHVHLTNVLGFSILRGFLHLLNHIHVLREISHSLVAHAETFLGRAR